MSFENLAINRIVIHEIFKRTEGREAIQPTYGTQLETLDPSAMNALIDRITSAMGSAAKSVELAISQVNDRSAISLARSLADASDLDFVQDSRAITDKLTEAQTSRGVPGGILVVFTGIAGFPAKRICGFIKAETHNGFTRRVSDQGTIALQFLEELLLTPQAKLYKIGVFCEQDARLPVQNGWRIFVYDEQITAKNKLTAAHIANLINAQLLFLESEDAKKDIQLFINSPGGSVYDGLAIYDTMNYIKCDVSTICVGLAASMGAFLMAAGAKGKRFALPNSRMLIHQVLGGAEGQASDIKIQAEEILQIKETLNKILAERTGQPYDKIDKDTDRDYYLTATGAVEYGLIDRVIAKIES